MNIFVNTLKIIFNAVLFVVYSLVSIVVVNFFDGLWVAKILEKQVPASTDIVHMKIGIFVVLLVLLSTLLLRKYFYFSLLLKEKTVKSKIIKLKPKTEEMTHDEFKSTGRQLLEMFA